MDESAIARLTEREKDCLRRWLDHRTAKEIALDLGISPHAVEKRLKMARAKLGVSSSLEAARMLVAAEGYQRLGVQTPDLDSHDQAGNQVRSRYLALGAVVMSLLVAAALAAALQPSGSAPDPVPTDSHGNPIVSNGRAIVYESPDPDRVTPTPAEVAVVVQNTFAVMDRNHSGFIEPDETPIMGDREEKSFTRDKDGTVHEIGARKVSAEQARARYIAMADKNGDGKWDFAEYREWMVPLLAKNGIPAKWREDMNTRYAAPARN